MRNPCISIFALAPVSHVDQWRLGAVVSNCRIRSKPQIASFIITLCIHSTKIYLIVKLSPLDSLSGILRSSRGNMIGLHTEVLFLFWVCNLIRQEHDAAIYGYAYPSRTPGWVCRRSLRPGLAREDEYSNSTSKFQVARTTQSLSFVFEGTNKDLRQSLMKVNIHPRKNFEAPNFCQSRTF